MSRPRFLTDQDFNEHIILAVAWRAPAVAVMRARVARLEASADDEILAFAAEEQWIVLSHDVNTMSGAAYARVERGEPMNGLLLVHQRSALAPIIDDLILIWTSSDAEEWIGQVRFLPL